MFEEERDSYFDNLEDFLSLRNQGINLTISLDVKKMLLNVNNEDELKRARTILNTFENLVDIMVKVNYRQAFIPTCDNYYVDTLIRLCGAKEKADFEEINKDCFANMGYLVTDMYLLNDDFCDYICEMTGMDADSNVSMLKIDTAIEALKEDTDHYMDNLSVLPMMNEQMSARLYQASLDSQNNKSYKINRNRQ